MERRIDLIENAAVADTCAVWNVLSSATLHGACVDGGFVFIVSKYVLYECMAKGAVEVATHHDLLRGRLSRAQAKGQFQAFALSVEDLQDIAQLEQRKRLSLGELSGIVLARRMGLGFQTDDQPARNLATAIIDAEKVQTTPHVLGWLFFHGRLVDGDLGRILSEHDECKRPLRRFFEEMYREAMRCRLLGRAAMERGA